MGNYDLIFSTPTQHYWNNNGAMQTEMDRLYKKFVPLRGCSANLNGEVIRAINRLYYEYCNNGNCNAAECEQHSEWVECEYCGGSGCDYVIDEETNDEYECVCDYCGGYGGYDDDVTHGYTIKHFYNNFIEIIRYFFNKYNCKIGINAINNIETFIINNNDFTIEENMGLYDKVCDLVVWLILNNENDDTPIPIWYDN